MGCDTCHTTHKVGEKGKQEFDNHLVKAVPELCIDCHDVKDAALIKAHQGSRSRTATCTQCHDPHQSAAAEADAALHASAVCRQDLRNLPRAREGRQSCPDQRRHARRSASPATASRRKRSRRRRCRIRARRANASRATIRTPASRPGFLQPDPVSACLACHSDQADQFKKAHLHQPAFRARMRDLP